MEMENDESLFRKEMISLLKSPEYIPFKRVLENRLEVVSNLILNTNWDEENKVKVTRLQVERTILLNLLSIESNLKG